MFNSWRFVLIDIRKMTVLIADDMENMFNSIKSIMKVNGYGSRYVYAPDGEEALRVLQEGYIDFAIIDNNMPKLTGLELLGIIRDDRQLRNLPVVMITAHAEKEFVSHAAESEIDAYILKPLTVQLIKQKIPAVIEKANKPSPMMAHLKQASDYEDVGEIDAAIEEVKLAIEANLKSSRPVRELGRYYMIKEDMEAAEKHLLKAAQMNRLDVVAFHLLGDLYIEKNDMDNALKYLVKAMDISPRNLDRGLNLGKILIRKKMVQKAAPVFTKVFQIAPNPTQLREEIGLLSIEEGAVAYGEKLLSPIIERSPNKVSLLIKLGFAIEKTGDQEKALEYLTQAEQLDPKNFDIKLRIAKIYIARGMIIRAEKPLKDILKVDPEHSEARQLMKQCI